MDFRIENPQNLLVGTVSAATFDELDVTYVQGTFVAGPGFAPIRRILDDFAPVYTAGDLKRAAMIHGEIDRMGLIATSGAGHRYLVSNLYETAGKILFFAILEEAWIKHGGFPGTTLVPPR